MADFIPFLTGSSSAQLAKDHFVGAKAYRIPLDSITKIMGYQFDPLWIDPSVDGIADVEKHDETSFNASWKNWALTLPHVKEIISPEFCKKPNTTKVKDFVFEVLKQCNSHKPKWITVPQLPCKGTTNNKLNRMMAEASGKWKSIEYNTADLIYPIVMTSQDETNSKVRRNPRIDQAKRGYVESGSTGIWTVEKSLNDDEGSSTFKSKRFPALINFHEELNVAIQSPMRIAGPYWAIQLALWSRNLIDHPAVGVGSGFQYQFLGPGNMNMAAPKVFAVPLRRMIRVSTRTIDWLADSEKRLMAIDVQASVFFRQLGELARRYPSSLKQTSEFRTQIAKQYRTWLDEIGSRPAAGRGMALYHHFTHAYAIGKKLLSLPETADPPRRPEQVAEQYMTNCL